MCRLGAIVAGQPLSAFHSSLQRWILTGRQGNCYQSHTLLCFSWTGKSWKYTLEKDSAWAEVGLSTISNRWEADWHGSNMSGTMAPTHHVCCLYCSCDSLWLPFPCKSWTMPQWICILVYWLFVLWNCLELSGKKEIMKGVKGIQTVTEQGCPKSKGVDSEGFVLFYLQKTNIQYKKWQLNSIK